MRLLLILLLLATQGSALLAQDPDPDGDRYRQQMTQLMIQEEQRKIRRNLPESPAYNIRGTRVTQRSSYLIQPNAPADVVMITVHGFGFDGQQFEEIGRDLALGNNVNWFNVVLPGHGVDKKNAHQYTSEDLAREVDATIEFAKKTGKKVVLVGQSTGGLLAFQQALSKKHQLDGMVLIEPALQVRPSINLVSCVGGMFLQQTGDLIPILAKMGLDKLLMMAAHDVSPSLGCEVDKLRQQIEKEFFGEPCFGFNDQSKCLGNGKIEELCAQISIPVLLMNRPGDEVVDSDVNDRCRKNLPQGKALTLPAGHHGSSELNPSTSNEGKAIFDFLQQFTTDNTKITIGKDAASLERKQNIDSYDKLMTYAGLFLPPKTPAQMLQSFETLVQLLRQSIKMFLPKHLQKDQKTMEVFNIVTARGLDKLQGDIKCPPKSSECEKLKSASSELMKGLSQIAKDPQRTSWPEIKTALTQHLERPTGQQLLAKIYQAQTAYKEKIYQRWPNLPLDPAYLEEKNLLPKASPSSKPLPSES